MTVSAASPGHVHRWKTYVGAGFWWCVNCGERRGRDMTKEASDG